MKQHINKVTSNCFYRIRRLKQVCRILGPENTGVSGTLAFLFVFVFSCSHIVQVPRGSLSLVSHLCAIILFLFLYVASGSREYSEKTLMLAMQCQSNLAADFEGTEILEPLAAIYDKPPLSTHSRQVSIDSCIDCLFEQEGHFHMFSDIEESAGRSGLHVFALYINILLLIAPTLNFD